MDFSINWLVATFALGDPITSTVAARGQTNPHGVVRLYTTRGCYAVKCYDHAPSQVAMTIESAAFTAGFPMAEPVFTVDGKSMASTMSAGKQMWVRVYRWVDGLPYEWGIVDPDLATQMGRLLAAMHALPVPQEILREDTWIPIGFAGWEELAQKADTKELTWAPLLKEKIHALVELENFVQVGTTKDEPSVPSQRDLHPPNVIRRPDGSHVIVDWDAAGPVIAREEVAMFALVWSTGENLPPDLSVVRAFIHGYRDAGGHYTSRGILDLVHREHSRLAWTLYNIRRHIDEIPGPNPWLPAALLEHVRSIDLDDQKRIASFFED
jgi:Phosphotransferase enzyme family